MKTELNPISKPKQRIPAHAGFFYQESRTRFAIRAFDQDLKKLIDLSFLIMRIPDRYTSVESKSQLIKSLFTCIIADIMTRDEEHFVYRVRFDLETVTFLGKEVKKFYAENVERVISNSTEVSQQFDRYGKILIIDNSTIEEYKSRIEELISTDVYTKIYEQFYVNEWNTLFRKF